MLRLACMIIGLIIISGCVPKRCERQIDSETAVRIAREYFLARSLAQLEAGSAADQKEARLMRRAGITEVTYRETFKLSVRRQSRRVDNIMCDHPHIYYDAHPSLNRDGFDVYFIRVTPALRNKDWRKSVTGINITKCGHFGGYFFTFSDNGFRRGISDPKKLGYVTCQVLLHPSEQ